MASIFTPKSIDVVTDSILDRKLAFIGVFFVVFTISFAILYAFDFYPELVSKDNFEPDEVSEVEEGDEIFTDEENVSASSVINDELEKTEVVFTGDELPRKLILDSLDREIDVLNPKSRLITELDAALLNGVVRHPDSATFNNEGNIFILGHSSYLPQVFNKNFQAFNGIQDLEWGDTIRMQSADTEYVYRVDKVYHAKANELTVPIADTGPKLTLATCNSFGSKDDRYIVESTLISKKPL
ncbi:sortase [Candidatus Kaiserbacteria bacterium]|nr:sortase [Candidatus Kaiserbacteria bacterium]